MSVARLLLVRHAPTGETRAARFPTSPGHAPRRGCAPLDDAGLESAGALGGLLPRADRCWSSYAVRACQTAEAAGFQAEPQAGLAECDFGAWAGRSLAEVAAADTDGLQRWFADPDHAPHGGESATALRARAADVLARVTGLGGTTLAFTHGGFVRAAVLAALGVPSVLAWKLDVAPLSVTELHHHEQGGWRLVRLNSTPQPAVVAP
ncbi:MAG: histidine phosphatase family protein [Egibacteraceae bacterium]